MRTIAIAAAAMMLAACAQTSEPISSAERAARLAPVLGPHSQCVDRATAAGLDRDAAAASCNCARTAVISGVSEETVRALRTDAMPPQATLARIEADLASVMGGAMRQCGLAR